MRPEVGQSGLLGKRIEQGIIGCHGDPDWRVDFVRSSQRPCGYISNMNDKIEPVFVVAGVDEVGRGPLVGSVVAAAVVLHPQRPIDGLLDSKKLTQHKRESLDVLIRERAQAWAIAEASPQEIDEINILHASLLAMSRAVGKLNTVLDLVLVDGNKSPRIDYPCQPIVKGDQHVQSISAASIIAKVARDKDMVELHQQYPQFGFDKHKGYPTAAHRDAIMRHGVLPQHRRSFKPVQQALKSRGAMEIV